MAIQANSVDSSPDHSSGRTTLDMETADILRRLTARFTLLLNQRVTRREALAIIENGMDEDTLNLFITRYNAVSKGSESV